jgi:hypothetical protein
MMETTQPDGHALPEGISAKEAPRRQLRVQVSLPAWVQVAPSRSVEATIVDLSANGFRLVSDELLTVGQVVRVLSRSEAVRGEIRWVAGHKAGGVFTKPAKPVAI